MSFISYLVNGLSLGSVYALIALGYTMVYGIAKMLNFAHGDVIMVGAFVILTAVTKASMSPILAIILSVVICTVAGVVIEAVAYRPLRKASSNLAVLITAIGVSYLLQNLALLIFGADAKSFVPVINVPSLELFGGQLTIKGVTIVTILKCNHFPYLCNRFRTCCNCRTSSLLRISYTDSLYRRNAWYQGFRSGSIRWNRFYPRSNGWRNSPWCY